MNPNEKLTGPHGIAVAGRVKRQVRRFWSIPWTVFIFNFDVIYSCSQKHI